MDVRKMSEIQTLLYCYIFCEWWFPQETQDICRAKLLTNHANTIKNYVTLQ